MFFFEYHFHGCAGHKTIELNRGAYEAISRFLLERGQTDAFLATFSAAPVESLVAALDFCRSLMEGNPLPGAQLAGVYLEGPFLRNAGGMTEALLLKPSLAEARRLLAAGRGIVKSIAIAPELPGAFEVIELFASEGIRVSAGHFNCSHECLKEAVKCGLSGITHFCDNGEASLVSVNGMYKTDGPFLEILADDRLTVEMICDGVHVDPRLLKAVWRIKGRERFIAITDGCAASGIPGKRLSFPDPAGAMADFDVKNGALYIADTDQLVGSLSTMDVIYNNLMKFCTMSAEDAEYVCSALPRKLVFQQGWKL